MSSRAASLIVVPLVLAVAVLTVRAQVTADRPGVMTPSLVHVQNRGAGEAVPVALTAPDVLAVHVVQPAAVTLAPGTVVPTHPVRQPWEYRTVHVVAGPDPADALTAAGRDGWEAVGVTASDQSGATFLMKRPAN